MLKNVFSVIRIHVLLTNAIKSLTQASQLLKSSGALHNKEYELLFDLLQAADKNKKEAIRIKETMDKNQFVYRLFYSNFMQELYWFALIKLHGNDAIFMNSIKKNGRWICLQRTRRG